MVTQQIAEREAEIDRGKREEEEEEKEGESEVIPNYVMSRDMVS